jgi:hypothetical protein
MLTAYRAVAFVWSNRSSYAPLPLADVTNRPERPILYLRAREISMADVTCPLTFEDWRTLLSHDTLPPTLRTILEDPARTVELAHGYELDRPEAEARSLLAHARSFRCVTSV